MLKKILWERRLVLTPLPPNMISECEYPLSCSRILSPQAGGGLVWVLVHGLYILLWGLVELEEELVHELEGVELHYRKKYYMIYALWFGGDRQFSRKQISYDSTLLNLIYIILILDMYCIIYIIERWL